MCLNPVSIINKTKFISKVYRQPYFMHVPCGHCVECQREKSNEWHYRSYFQFKHCIENGGYVLFDTLTYSNKYLPHLSDFMDVPKHLDYPCFSYRDIRLFFVRLRKRLKDSGYLGKLDYFVASEYGLRPSDGVTYRPHYHILLFVNDSFIKPDDLSLIISDCWYFGRTDGFPYKSLSYVRLHNVISGDVEKSLRVSRYVSKYVVKSCKFDSVINDRLRFVCENEAINHEVGWLDSYDGKKYRSDLYRYVAQFHRQSKFFGISALDSIPDFQNFVIMPDLDKIVVRFKLPMYFKRKLYQELVVVDGSKFWSYTDKGLEFLKIQNKRSLDCLVDSLIGKCNTYGIDILKYGDVYDIADYILNKRGYFNVNMCFGSLVDRIQEQCLYNYITHKDNERFGKKFVSAVYCGLSDDSYIDIDESQLYDVDYMKRCCYFDSLYENFLCELSEKMVCNNISLTRLEYLKQHLTQLYKSFV